MLYGPGQTEGTCHPEITQVELVIDGAASAACAVWVQARLDGVTASADLWTERAYISASAAISARARVDAGILARAGEYWVVGRDGAGLRSDSWRTAMCWT